ncbi:hypothetical protein ACFX13_045649 [Malus domestica]
MLMEIEIEIGEGDRDRATDREGRGRVGISAPLLQILDLLFHLRLNDEYSDVKRDDLSNALWLSLKPNQNQKKLKRVLNLMSNTW